MARRRVDWIKTRGKWIEERRATGLSLASFCRKHHLTLNTAKRHLNIKQAEDGWQPKESEGETKPEEQLPKNGTKRRGAPIGNQNARKHGAYSKLINPDLLDWADTTPIEQDYIMARANMMDCIGFRKILREEYCKLLRRIGDNSNPLSEVEFEAFHGLKKEIEGVDLQIQRWKTTQDLHLKALDDSRKTQAEARVKALTADKLEKEIEDEEFSVDDLLAKYETEL